MNRHYLSIQGYSRTRNLYRNTSEKNKMNKRKYSDEEIRQMAKEFVDKMFAGWEKYCELCNAKNCTYNKTCINCNRPFEPHTIPNP